MKKPIKQLIWLPTGGHIGDAVLIMSLFSEVAQKQPALKIMYVLRRNAPFIAQLAHSYPSVEIVPLPYSPLPALKTVLALLKQRAIVIVPPPRKTHPLVIKVVAALCKLRGDTVIGFCDKYRWQPYGIKLEYQRDEKYMDNLRRALSRASIQAAPIGTPPRLVMKTSLPKDFPFASRPYIVVHPFAHMATYKTMPLRRWRDLIAALKRDYPSCGIVITGADVDRAQAQELSPLSDPDIVLAIGLPILQLAGVIDGAKLYIGIDTGPTHIAGVLREPSVVLAQQNEPAWLPTYNPNATMVTEKKNCMCGVPGKTCEAWEDGHAYRRCVYDISDEAIASAIRERLASPRI